MTFNKWSQSMRANSVQEFDDINSTPNAIKSDATASKTFDLQYVIAHRRIWPCAHSLPISHLPANVC